jgi:hypothetical protein
MWDPWAKTRASDELRGRLKWFLFGRVIVVSCFLAMFGVSFLRGGDRYAGVDLQGEALLRPRSAHHRLRP